MPLPNNNEPLAAALNAHREGQFALAESRYREVLRREPRNADAHHLFGVLCLQRGDLTAAEDAIRSAISLAPGRAHFHGNLGEALRAGRRPAEAEAAYRAAIALAPDYADAHNNLALVLAAGGHLDGAIEHLERALALDPEAPETLANLGNALRRAGRVDAAEDAFSRALRLRPDFDEVRLLLCRSLLDRGAVSAVREQASIAERHAPDAVATHALVALLRWHQGERAGARHHALRVLECEHPPPASGLACAEVLIGLGYLPEACRVLERLRAGPACDADLLVMLGAARLAQNQLDRAHGAATQAVQESPGHLAARLLLARVLRTQDRVEEAEQVLDAAPGDVAGGVPLALERADLALHRGRPARALQVIDAALREAPAHPGLLERQGQALLEGGDAPRAAAVLREAVRLAPERVSGYYRLAFAGRCVAEDRTLFQPLCERVASRSLSAAEAVSANFALAKVLDDGGDMRRAMAHYHRANRALHRQTRYHPQQVDDLVSTRIEVYTAPRIRALQAHGSASRVPVIIAGMPRSGTTLVEQIIASHPEGAGAGEIDRLTRLAPGGARDLAAALDAIADSGSARPVQLYLERLGRDVAPAARICDKTPQNFTNLGLAAILFPGAAIIHCRRNPLDTCLSAYVHNLDQGNEFATTARGLAHYYASYRRLMAHWAAVLPAGCILDVDYEELVRDPAAQARRLIAFCGLDWDDGCLDFHARKASVRSSSVWQVRQPLYGTSVDRWRRYGETLSPLRRALAREGIELPD